MTIAEYNNLRRGLTVWMVMEMHGRTIRDKLCGGRISHQSPQHATFVIIPHNVGDYAYYRWSVSRADRHHFTRTKRQAMALAVRIKLEQPTNLNDFLLANNS